MGALGTGFSQGYHGQVGQPSPYPIPGGVPGVPPPYTPAPKKGGGGLKELMGMFGGGEKPSGLEGLSQFAAPSIGGPPTGSGGMMDGFFPAAAGGAGGGLKAAMGGAGGAAGGAGGGGGIMALLAKLGPLLAL